jgi:hypothetical protein
LEKLFFAATCGFSSRGGSGDVLDVLYVPVAEAVRSLEGLTLATGVGTDAVLEGQLICGGNSQIGA